MILAVALAVAQSGLSLRLPLGETLTFRETFILTQRQANEEKRATATRTQTWFIKEVRRGTATVDVKFSDLTAVANQADPQAQSLSVNLRAAIDRDSGLITVDERGRLNIGRAPEGIRPFFGLILPARRDALPDSWTEKVIPPFGVEKPIEFRYRFAGLSAEDTATVYRISLRASLEEKEVKFNLSGDLFVTPDGRLVRSLVDSRFEEGGSVMNLSYRVVGPGPAESQN